MTRFSGAQLKRREILGICVTIAGILMILVPKISHDDAGFRHDWLVMIGGAGLVCAIVGAAWLAMSLAHHRTRFFDIDRPMSFEGMLLAGSCAAIAVAVLVMTAIAKLPDTPPDKLPNDTESRELQLRTERNLRLLTCLAVISLGGAIAAFPVIRHFRRNVK